VSEYIFTDGHHVVFPIARVAGRRLFPLLAAAQHSDVASNWLGSLTVSAFRQVVESLREDVMRHGQRSLALLSLADQSLTMQLAFRVTW